MVEWSITTVLKTVVPRGTGGSNPSLSAKVSLALQVGLFSFLERGDEKTRGFVTVSPKGATLSKRSGERIPLSPQAQKST